ncbi:MAG: Uma2 family endonuclease, partial [Anaerolineae bacterium]|nr:Uma2 family endonuclease [Anaerolineae bacterium]
MSEREARTKLTGDDLLEIQAQTGKRYELIDGELVEMAPTGMPHSAIEFNIAFLLGQYVRQRQLGRILVGEVGFYVRNDPYTVRGADVAFIRREKLPQTGLPEGFSTIVPDLVVEVVSPNDRSADIAAKVAEWLAFGVETVWVVYPSERTVHVHRQSDTSQVLSGDDLLEGSGALAGFNVPVRAIFESQFL